MTTSTNVAGRVPAWTVSDRMRKARELEGLTQSQLAKAIGIKRNTVSNYEVGTTAPKRPVLLSWALACQVDLDWLITGRTLDQPDPGAVFNSGCRKNVSALARVRRITPSGAARWAERVA